MNLAVRAGVVEGAMSKAFELTPGNVKTAMKEVGATSADLWQVAYEDLHILPGFNVREHDKEWEAHVQNIAVLMAENGYHRDKPMAGYVAVIEGKNRIVVTDGHCRHAAIAVARGMGAEIAKVPVVIKQSGTSAEDLTVALVTSNSGRQLTFFELGTVCKRLQGYGWDEKQIAKRLNFTKTYVDDLLFLQACPADIRKLVQDGAVSAYTAVATVRKHGDKALAVLTGAVQKAAEAGKAKATDKHLAPDWKKECKKAGTKLYEAVMWVKEDAAYAKLSKGTREMIEELISALPEEPQKS